MRSAFKNIKLSLIVSIFAIVLVMGLFGCTQQSDINSVAQNVPEVQQFLAQNPHANLSVSLLPFDSIAGLNETNCPLPLEPRDYYLVNIIDSNSGLKLVAYLDANTQQTVCAYTINSQGNTNTPRGSLDVSVLSYTTGLGVGNATIVVCKDNHDGAVCNASAVSGIAGSVVTTNTYGQAGFNLAYGDYLVRVVNGDDNSTLKNITINSQNQDLNVMLVTPQSVQRGGLNVWVQSYTTNNGVANAELIICKDAHTASNTCNESNAYDTETTNIYGQGGFNLEYGDYLLRVINGTDSNTLKNVTINSSSMDLNVWLVTPQPTQRGNLNVYTYTYGTNAPVSGVELIVCKSNGSTQCDENIAAADFGSTAGVIVTTGVGGQAGFNLEYGQYLLTVVRPDHNLLKGPIDINSAEFDMNVGLVVS